MKLGVNIDHVATLRQQRFTKYPDPVAAAADVEQGGADQITVHLREDRRHIQDRDVIQIRESISTTLNLEMAATDEMVEIALKVRPEIVCFVPERREELTTEGGLDVLSQMNRLGEIIPRIQDAGIHVSLFVNPDKEQVEASRELRSYAIEIHTGAFAEAKSEKEREAELFRIIHSAKHGKEIGLHVHAGHGLDYINVKPIVQIPEIEELNIGHSIVCRALFVGLEQAVRDMATLVRGGK